MLFYSKNVYISQYFINGYLSTYYQWCFVIQILVYVLTWYVKWLVFWREQYVFHPALLFRVRGWISVKWRNVCACSTRCSNISLFQLSKMGPSHTFISISSMFTLHIYILQSRWNLDFRTCWTFLHWVPEDSPFIWQESNLLVWAHLEFVSTDNLNIYAPTNIQKPSKYVYLSYKYPILWKHFLNPSPAFGTSR